MRFDAAGPAAAGFSLARARQVLPRTRAPPRKAAIVPGLYIYCCRLLGKFCTSNYKVALTFFTSILLRI